MSNFLVAIHFVTGIVTMVIASLFLFSKRYFPYHEEIAGMKWNDIDGKLRMVVLAIMRVAGSGLFAVSCTILLLTLYYVQYRIPFLPLLVSLLATLFWSCISVITGKIHAKTKAKTPWRSSMVLAIVNSAGLLLSLWNGYNG